MNAWIKPVIAALFLLGLAACSQTNTSTGPKAITKSEQTVKTSQTNTKPQASKNETSSAATAAKTGVQADQVPVSLVDTVDGDTIKVMYNGKEETVRYLLIDTPEEKKPHTCVQPYAVEAYNRNKELLNSGNLTLEFDHGNKTDKYGRLLAYVYVDGKSIQEQLLKEGYARVAYIYEPTYKYLDVFRNDESQAKNQKLRIWAKAGYATDRGFIGCVNGQSSLTTTSQKLTGANSSSITSQSSGYQTTGISGSSSGTATASGGSSGATEFFANCTELRKKYPNGVPKGHPAYQEKMDRDHDGYACER